MKQIGIFEHIYGPEEIIEIRGIVTILKTLGIEGILGMVMQIRIIGMMDISKNTLVAL